MTPARAATYIGGAVLLAAWLSSAATSPQQAEPSSAPRPEPTSGTDTLAADVQAQAARLRSRLAAAPSPQEPSRNPFAFAPRDEGSVRQAPRAAAVPDPVFTSDPSVPEPELSLIGVAEDQSPEGPVRTAIIAGAADELYMVKAGQDVAGRYRVTVVAADAVELHDALTGSLRRLALK